MPNGESQDLILSPVHYLHFPTSVLLKAEHGPTLVVHIHVYVVFNSYAHNSSFIVLATDGVKHMNRNCYYNLGKINTD